MVEQEYWSRLNAQLGLTDTSWRRAFFTEWARWEGTGAKWNPLATTFAGGEDPNDPFWNSFTGAEGATYHVRNYATEELGVRATAATLRLSYYPAVMAALRNEAWRDEDRADIAAQIRTWGTVQFADLIAEGWRPSVGAVDAPEALPVSPPLAGTLEARVAALEEALTIVMQAHASDISALRRDHAADVAALNNGALLRFALLRDATTAASQNAWALAIELADDASDSGLPEANELARLTARGSALAAVAPRREVAGA